jgi:hypothetical protein
VERGRGSGKIKECRERGRRIKTAASVILAVYLAAWFLPENAHARQRGQVREGNVTVVFDEPLGDAAGAVLEIYPAIRGEVEDTLGRPAGFRHTVLLMKDPEEFRAATGSGLVVAFAYPQKYLVAVDYNNVIEKPFTLRETLKHELCHLALHHHIEGPEGKGGVLPRWVNEGVCQWASGGVSELATLGRSTEITRAALLGGLLPLSSLERGFPRGERSLTLAYEESKSVIAYIAGHYGRRGVLGVLENLRAGYPAGDAVRRSLGVTLEELEAAWHAELKREHTWVMWTSNNIHVILFALGGLMLFLGFMRVLWKMRTYRDEEEE